MARKVDEVMATISERCIICREVFIKGHPKDNRTICEKCATKIAKLIGVEPLITFSVNATNEQLASLQSDTSVFEEVWIEVSTSND